MDNGNGGRGDVGSLKGMFVVKSFNFWRGFRKPLRRRCNTCCSFTVMPLSANQSLGRSYLRGSPLSLTVDEGIRTPPARFTAPVEMYQESRVVVTCNEANLLSAINMPISLKWSSVWVSNCWAISRLPATRIRSSAKAR